MAQLKQLPMVRKGEMITARLLSDIARNLNSLTGQANKRTGDKEKLVDGKTLSPGKDTTINEEFDQVYDLPPPERTWIETERSEQVVRITNPDDSDQHVDIGKVRIMRMVNLKGEVEYRAYESGVEG